MILGFTTLSMVTILPEENPTMFRLIIAMFVSLTITVFAILSAPEIINKYEIPNKKRYIKIFNIRERMIEKTLNATVVKIDDSKDPLVLHWSNWTQVYISDNETDKTYAILARFVYDEKTGLENLETKKIETV